MGAIRFGPPASPFGGIVPRTSKRALPENAAQIAVNCRLSDGELIPFNEPAKAAVSGKSAPLLSIFRIYEDGNYAWMTWGIDVDVVKASLFGTGRWCYTGDGEPRITTLADATNGGGGAYPNVAYTLGTPKPIVAPSIAPSGGVGSTVERYYAYTFYSEWVDIELEGAVSPISTLVSGKVDGTWAVTGMSETPPNSGTVAGVYSSGYTEFTDTLPHWLRVGEQVVISGNTLDVTHVTATNKFKVYGDYHAATTWERKAHFAGTLKKRLYRTTGTSGQWQLVAEGITGTTYNDTLTDAQIPGDELISADWDMPPTDLKGLILLPSGALAGFTKNKVCISEPNQPQAWPAGYQLDAVDYPVVALGCFGTGIAVATDSTPYIINGVEPGQMSMSAWGEVLPCLSKRSMVSLGAMAVYASAHGLIAVSGSGASIWSLPYFTKHEFDDLTPSSMVSAMSEGRLYVLYNNGNSRCLLFNLLGDVPYLSEAHFDANDIYADSTTGKLYLSKNSDIYEFDPIDGRGMSQDWMSKEINLSRPQNLGAAKVSFDQVISPAQAAAIEAEIASVLAYNAPLLASGNVHGAWNVRRFNMVRMNGSDLKVPPDEPLLNEVTFQLYSGSSSGVMKLRASRLVTGSLPFTLPSGYKSDSVAVRVISRCRIKSVEVGGTKQELAAA